MPDCQADIFIVEDNPDDLELTLNALNKEAWVRKTLVVRDGEEALDCLLGRGAFSGQAVNPPRFILLDLKLPKVNGIDVLKELKRHPATKSIPVVIFTSSSEECDLAQSYELGANSYVQKPVNFDDFRKTVDALKSYWMMINHPAPATD